VATQKNIEYEADLLLNESDRAQGEELKLRKQASEQGMNSPVSKKAVQSVTKIFLHEKLIYTHHPHEKTIEQDLELARVFSFAPYITCASFSLIAKCHRFHFLYFFMISTPPVALRTRLISP